MINENLVDQPFLDKYCVGYDEKTLPADAPKNGHYKAYILGEGDDKNSENAAVGFANYRYPGGPYHQTGA
ncbi:hypothetical protein ACLB1O_09115 [Escherichia coli]